MQAESEPHWHEQAPEGGSKSCPVPTYPGLRQCVQTMGVNRDGVEIPPMTHKTGTDADTFWRRSLGGGLGQPGGGGLQWTPERGYRKSEKIFSADILGRHSQSAENHDEVAESPSAKL